MYCSKCSNKLNKNAEFCTKCGKKVEKNSNAFINNVEKKNSRKKLVIIISILIFIIICFIFVFFFSSSNLSWNETYSIYHQDFISPGIVKLGINFDDIEKLDEINVVSNCGTVERNGFELEWNLSDSNGKCKITVSHNLKKISKEYSLFKFEPENNFALKYEIDLNSSEDIDFDGLTNKEETKYKTNLELSDSDMDNLDDKYEIFNSKTNPNNSDTDNDGISDYDEIELKLNPLMSVSKNDNINDGDRINNFDIVQGNAKLSITGKGNIASSILKVNSNTKISDKKGMINNLYSISSTADVEKVVLSISYTKSDIINNSLNEDSLSLYKYDHVKSQFTKIDTKIDKKNKELIGSVELNANYIVGDGSVANEINKEVLFILDNSWSMYTNEQYTEITGQEFNGGLLAGLFGETELYGYDKEGARFKLTGELVSNLSKKNFKMGLAEFRKDYASVVKIGDSSDIILSKLGNMFGNFTTKKEGTDISNALLNGINQFSKTSEYRYIVILTDGSDSYLKSNVSKIVNSSISHNVKICSIGFGDGSINNDLAFISARSGCGFYSSSDSSGLKELFDNVGSELDDGLIDINTDENTDGFIIADSGFLVNRDGFSFKNYSSNISDGGHCYGMATIAQLYYQKKLPLKVGSLSVPKYFDNSYEFDLSKTYFKDYSSLYDYKIKTKGINLFLSNDVPPDFYNVIDKKLTINEPYKTEIINTGLFDISVRKSSLSDEKQLEMYGFVYETGDKFLLNEDKMQTSKLINNDDLQILNAIYAGFIKQETDIFYSSGMDDILWTKNFFGIESIENIKADGFINFLSSRLISGDAPVISAKFDNQFHAVNAISLIQDIYDPNHYYIAVYDNNYPGMKRFVDVKCNKKACLTVSNGYYSGNESIIRITSSLADDLNFFNK